MKPVEKLHYALGEIAYALVWSDSKIEAREIHGFMDTLTADLEVSSTEFDLLGVMFNAITGDKKDVWTTYLEAMSEIRKNAEHMDQGLKERFIKTLERVEHAYAPFTLINKRFNMVDHFKKDIEITSCQLFYVNTFSLN